MTRQGAITLGNFIKKQMQLCTCDRALASYQTEFEYLKKAFAEMLTDEQIEQRLARVQHLRDVLKGSTQDNRTKYHAKRAAMNEQIMLAAINDPVALRVLGVSV